jgi:hypothetical protein
MGFIEIEVERLPYPTSERCTAHRVYICSDTGSSPLETHFYVFRVSDSTPKCSNKLPKATVLKIVLFVAPIITIRMSVKPGTKAAP